MVESAELLCCVNNLQEWIVSSEMQGTVDVSDSFYPAYKQLEFLREKLEEQNDHETSGTNNR